MGSYLFIVGWFNVSFSWYYW